MIFKEVDRAQREWAERDESPRGMAVFPYLCFVDWMVLYIFAWNKKVDFPHEEAVAFFCFYPLRSLGFGPGRNF